MKSPLTPRATIKGRLSPMPTITGTITATGSGPPPNPYEGEYTVTPSAIDTQVLPTANKFLEDDILVKSVPYYEVSNTQGGLTVSIAT